jgi:hypothetical protein
MGKGSERNRGREAVDPKDLAPGTLAGELDIYDNLIVPVSDALRAAEDWKRANPSGPGAQG